MRWKRIVDTAAFVLAVTLATYVKYGLEGSWYAAIALAVIVYIPTPFILSRVWAIFLIRGTEQTARQTDKPE